jgi:hypothetical protein
MDATLSTAFFLRCFDEEMVDDDAAMAVPRCVAAQRGRVLGLLLFSW